MKHLNFLYCCLALTSSLLSSCLASDEKHNERKRTSKHSTLNLVDKEDEFYNNPDFLREIDTLIASQGQPESKHPKKESQPLSFESPFFKDQEAFKHIDSLVEDRKKFYCRHLASESEHTELLKRVIINAKRKLVITSYDAHESTMEHLGLYDLLTQAHRRGVKIYIYLSDVKHLSRKVENLFERLKVGGLNLNTHTKFLSADNTIAVVGSYNWLSGAGRGYENSVNGSIVCEGTDCAPLIQEFWKHIRYYGNQQFSGRRNERSVEAFERNSHNYAVFCREDKTSSMLFPNLLEHHLGFLEEDVFEKAQRQIIICSPFIYDGNYQQDFNARTMTPALRRGINIFFVAGSMSQDLPQLRAYLQRFNFPQQLHVLTYDNFHCKTVIVDDQTICEGSFNWLSASRDFESESHNHEASLVYSGEKAKPLIAHFFATQMGRFIQEKIAEGTRAVSSAKTSAPLPSSLPSISARKGWSRPSTYAWQEQEEEEYPGLAEVLTLSTREEVQRACSVPQHFSYSNRSNSKTYYPSSFRQRPDSQGSSEEDDEEWEESYSD